MFKFIIFCLQLTNPTYSFRIRDQKSRFKTTQKQFHNDYSIIYVRGGCTKEIPLNKTTTETPAKKWRTPAALLDASSLKAKKKKRKSIKKSTMLKKKILTLKDIIVYFFCSIIDPTCRGEIKIKKKKKRKKKDMDDTFGGMMSTGQSFGAVCGPNGCS